MKKFLILVPLFFLIGCATTSSTTNECTSGNCYSGEGTYRYADKNGKYAGTYTGMFKNGKKHGKGMFVFKGKPIVGVWENGLLLPEYYLTEEINKKKTKKEERDTLLAKQETCETLGFEIGTSPNGECVLKLMELEAQVAASTQTVINNNTGSDSATVNALAETQRQILIQRQSQALINMGSALINSGKPKINCRQTLTGFSCY